MSEPTPGRGSSPDPDSFIESTLPRLLDEFDAERSGRSLSPEPTLWDEQVPSPEVRKSAQISVCGRFRYTLMRRWEAGTPLRFVMLNPSTADAALDDPTIRRCVGFARREGFAAAIVLNLYAYRATDPKALPTCGDAVGPLNDAHLYSALTSAEAGSTPVVAAWGVNARPGRVAQVLDLVPGVDWRCLGTTKDGHPRHPLYVKGDQPLVPFGGRP